MDQTVFSWKSDDATNKKSSFSFRSRAELGRFEININKDEWLDFIELTLADWLEQVEGAAAKPSSLFLWKEGEAYAYRRTAYRKMAEILSIERPERLGTVVPDMMKSVYGTESHDTRHLVQLRTPPMSDASAKALEALRAIGENIPVDLSPKVLLNIEDSCLSDLK